MSPRFTFSICVMYDFISEKDTMRQLKGGKVKGIYCTEKYTMKKLQLTDDFLLDFSKLIKSPKY